ncbi:MAG: hypothetical protein F9K22_12360 [Bacteroidetes bacterium]|nr:MAG: hypothetical protein F9K22_12360 [Bacteroidota bacterium]
MSLSLLVALVILMELIRYSRRRIMNTLRYHDSLSPGSAKTLAELGIRNTFAVSTLLLSGVVKKEGPDRYFLDSDRLRKLEGWQLMFLYVIFTIAVVFLLVVWAKLLLSP